MDPAGRGAIAHREARAPQAWSRAAVSAARCAGGPPQPGAGRGSAARDIAVVACRPDAAAGRALLQWPRYGDPTRRRRQQCHAPARSGWRIPPAGYRLAGAMHEGLTQLTRVPSQQGRVLARAVKMIPQDVDFPEQRCPTHLEKDTAPRKCRRQAGYRQPELIEPMRKHRQARQQRSPQGLRKEGVFARMWDEAMCLLRQRITPSKAYFVRNAIARVRPANGLWKSIINPMRTKTLHHCRGVWRGVSGFPKLRFPSLLQPRTLTMTPHYQSALDCAASLALCPWDRAFHRPGAC